MGINYSQWQTHFGSYSAAGSITAPDSTGPEIALVSCPVESGPVLGMKLNVLRISRRSIRISR